MGINEIACCGAYCKTCKEYISQSCRGCTIGYKNGGRDISKAKCRIKVCCFREKKLETCADCNKFDTCELIQQWFVKKGYTGKKFKESIEYIRRTGYESFLEIADNWKNCYGKLT